MEIEDQPFVGTEAVAARLFTRRTLKSRNTLLYRNVYLPGGVEVTAALRAEGAWLWSGREATLSGQSAAAWLGTDWIGKDEKAELTRPQAASNKIMIHRERLRDEEVMLVRGIPTTTPARTACDLGRRGWLRTAVARVDALANATGLTAPQVNTVLLEHAGARGIVQLRNVVELMDGGAESPQETHTRLLLIDAGLQRPVTQIREFDRWGFVFARIDMGWPEFKVGVEYDGPQHWTDPERRNRDIDRYAELSRRGWILIRVNAELLYKRPSIVVERVVAALRERGCPWATSVGSCHASGENAWR